MIVVLPFVFQPRMHRELDLVRSNAMLPFKTMRRGRQQVVVTARVRTRPSKRTFDVAVALTRSGARPSFQSRHRVWTSRLRFCALRIVS